MTDPNRPRFPYPHAAPTGAHLPDEDLQAGWEASSLKEKWQWLGIYEGLFSGMGRSTYLKRAERLSGYGFHPHSLSEVCSNPRFAAALPDSEKCDERNAEAYAALANEAALYYSTGYSMSRDAELGYSRRLIALGWFQLQVASLLGVTKQRVSALLKQKRTTFGPFSALPQIRPSTEHDG